MVVGSSTFLFDYKVDPETNHKSCKTGMAVGRLAGVPIPLLLADGGCDLPDQLLHYDPMNAMLHGNQAIYDVINGTVPAAGPGFGAGVPVANPLDTNSAYDRMRKQGIIFIYQNFNYKTLENQDIML